MNRGRPGCLGGLLRLVLLTWLFEFLEERFGFGKGCSCSGVGCGVILLVLFVIFACYILASTRWGHLTVLPPAALFV